MISTQRHKYINRENLIRAKKVRILPKDWWDAQPKDRDGDVRFSGTRKCFSASMARHYCGKVLSVIRTYTEPSDGDNLLILLSSGTYDTGWIWTEEMIDTIVE